MPGKSLPSLSRSSTDTVPSFVANANLIYGIPASSLETTLETTPEELKAALLRYGSAIRDCNLLDEQTRQTLRNGYCELARILPKVQGDNDKDSVHLDRIAAETIRSIQEFDSQFPPVDTPSDSRQ